MQHADVVVGMNRPAKFNITVYGPGKHMIPDHNIVVWHMIKTRYSEPGNMLWFKLDGKLMKLIEIQEPEKRKNQMNF